MNTRITRTSITRLATIAIAAIILTAPTAAATGTITAAGHTHHGYTTDTSTHPTNGLCRRC